MFEVAIYFFVFHGRFGGAVMALFLIFKLGEIREFKKKFDKKFTALNSHLKSRMSTMKISPPTSLT